MREMKGLVVYGDEEYGYSAHYEQHIDDTYTLIEPCPFCGGSDISITNTHTPCYTVECDCGAQMVRDAPAWKGSRIINKSVCIDLHYSAFCIVVNAWNHRVIT